MKSVILPPIYRMYRSGVRAARGAAGWVLRASSVIKFGTVLSITSLHFPRTLLTLHHSRGRQRAGDVTKQRAYPSLPDRASVDHCS